MKASEKVTASPELKIFMDLHKLESLATLLAIDDAELLKMDAFGWRLMKEVLRLREI